MEEIKDPLILANPHGYYEGGEYPETSPAVRSSAFQANTAVAEPAAIEDFYPDRPARVYEEQAPTIRSDRTGLKVSEPAVLGWTRSNTGKGDPTYHPVSVANCVTAAKRDNTQNYVVEPQPIKSIPSIQSIIEQAKTAHPSRGIILIKNTPCWVRRLTERELFRLMDVDENDIDTLLNAGISNTQLAKLAGNSVVCACYYHIFRKLFIDTNANINEQLQLF